LNFAPLAHLPLGVIEYLDQIMQTGIRVFAPIDPVRL